MTSNFSSSAILAYLGTNSWLTLVGLEKFARWFITAMVVVLIVVTIIVASPEGCVSVPVGTSQFVPLSFWKPWRNVLYLLLLLELVLLIPVAIGWHLQKNSTQLIQLIQSWFKVLVFITLSYGLAGLVVDLMYVVKFLHITIFDLDTSMVTGCWYKL